MSSEPEVEVYFGDLSLSDIQDTNTGTLSDDDDDESIEPAIYKNIKIKRRKKIPDDDDDNNDQNNDDDDDDDDDNDNNENNVNKDDDNTDDEDSEDKIDENDDDNKDSEDNENKIDDKDSEDDEIDEANNDDKDSEDKIDDKDIDKIDDNINQNNENNENENKIDDKDNNIIANDDKQENENNDATENDEEEIDESDIASFSGDDMHILRKQLQLVNQNFSIFRTIMMKKIDKLSDEIIDLKKHVTIAVPKRNNSTKIEDIKKNHINIDTSIIMKYSRHSHLTSDRQLLKYFYLNNKQPPIKKISPTIYEYWCDNKWIVDNRGRHIMEVLGHNLQKCWLKLPNNPNELFLNVQEHIKNLAKHDYQVSLLKLMSEECSKM